MLQRAQALRLFVFVLMFGVLLPPQNSYGADVPDALKEEVMRPDAKNGPTQVAIGIWVADVSRIDSVAQTLSANMLLAMHWRDPALAHGGGGIKRYNLEDVWHPNWMVANAYEPVTRTLPEVVEVSGDGTVQYRQRLLGIFTHSMDLHTFPFDSSDFRIQFVMVGQTSKEITFVPADIMVVHGMSAGAGIANVQTQKDWLIKSVSAGEAPYQLVPGLENAGYAIEFHAERLTAYYIVKVIIPLLLIVIMSWTVFWIDPSEGGSQISVATTSMLTLIAYRFAVGADVPKLAYLTHLDAFILVSSVLVLLTLVEAIVTTKMAHQNQLNLARKIDHHARWAFPLAYVVVFVATLFR